MAVKIKRGDRRPGATITCNADLSLASSVRLLGKLGGQLIINRAAVLGTDPKTVVIETWETTDTANPGRLLLEVEATWADGTTQTFPGDKYIEVDIIPDLG